MCWRASRRRPVCAQANGSRAATLVGTKEGEGGRQEVDCLLEGEEGAKEWRVEGSEEGREEHGNVRWSSGVVAR